MTSNFDTSISDSTIGIESVSDVMAQNEYDFSEYCQWENHRDDAFLDYLERVEDWETYDKVMSRQ